MAATVSKRKDERTIPWLTRSMELSSMTADESNDIAHGGPSGLKVDQVTWEVLVPPTSPCVVSLDHDRSNDDTTNNTCRIYARAEQGGDLSGCVILLKFHFYAAKSGGTGS